MKVRGHLAGVSALLLHGLRDKQVVRSNSKQLFPLSILTGTRFFFCRNYTQHYHRFICKEEKSIHVSVVVAYACNSTVWRLRGREVDGRKPGASLGHMVSTGSVLSL